MAFCNLISVQFNGMDEMDGMLYVAYIYNMDMPI